MYRNVFVASDRQKRKKINQREMEIFDNFFLFYDQLINIPVAFSINEIRMQQQKKKTQV